MHTTPTSTPNNLDANQSTTKRQHLQDKLASHLGEPRRSKIKRPLSFTRHYHKQTLNCPNCSNICPVGGHFPKDWCFCSKCEQYFDSKGHTKEPDTFYRAFRQFRGRDDHRSLLSPLGEEWLTVSPGLAADYVHKSVGPLNGYRNQSNLDQKSEKGPIDLAVSDRNSQKAKKIITIKFIAFFGETLIEKSRAIGWCVPALANQERQDTLTRLLEKYAQDESLELEDRGYHSRPQLRFSEESTNAIAVLESHGSSKAIQTLEPVNRTLDNDGQGTLDLRSAERTYEYRQRLIRWVCKYRSEIAQYFLNNTCTRLRKSHYLHKDIEVSACPHQSSHSLKIEQVSHSDSDSDIDFERPEAESALTSLVSTNAFKGLVATTRAQLWYNNLPSFDRISHQVSDRLGLFREKKPLHQIDLEIAWENNFILQSGNDQDQNSLSNLIAVTGVAHHAQATTILDYVSTRWPLNGVSVLSTLDHALCGMASANYTSQNPYSYSESFENQYSSVAPQYRTYRRGPKEKSLSISIQAYKGNNQEIFLKVSAEGSVRTLKQLVQQLAWIGSVTRTSPFEGKQLAYMEAKLESLNSSKPGFKLFFEASPVSATENVCWLPLFAGMSIAKGFPIPPRGNEVGLEIPIDIMAALAGAHHALEYEGGIIIKGFSCIFVPVNCISNTTDPPFHWDGTSEFFPFHWDGSGFVQQSYTVQSYTVQWHLIVSPNPKKPLLYQDVSQLCPTRVGIADLHLGNLRNSRAIVGWCTDVNFIVGSHSANYAGIDYSRAKSIPKGVNFDGGSVGIQQIGLAQLNFKMNSVQMKFHFPRSTCYEDIIDAAEVTPVILYDTVEKRGWLLQATYVMLHIAYHRNYLKPFSVNGEHIKFFETDMLRQNARERLLNNASVKLRDSANYSFETLVSSIWSCLEGLIALNMRNEEITGSKISFNHGNTLEGYEFRAIVDQRAPTPRKKFSIANTCGGWPELARDINAIVLFAEGFGDLLEPMVSLEAETHCKFWQRVPKLKDYLAAPVDVLIDLAGAAGHRKDCSSLSSTNLQWNRGKSTLFEPCQNPTSINPCCNRLQQIDRKLFLPADVVPPGPLVKTGAVVFGKFTSLKISKTLTIQRKSSSADHSNRETFDPDTPARFPRYLQVPTLQM